MATETEYKREPLEKILSKYGIEGVHPAADLLPMASDEEFQSMCVDVSRNGFLHPVKVTDNNLLIDGRNRIQVGWALSLDPGLERFTPVNALLFVLSENVHRRQLSVGQIAMVAKKIAKLSVGKPKKDEALRILFDTKQLEANGSGPGITREQAAQMLGTTTLAISQASTIMHWAPQEAEKVADGTMSLEEGYKIARRNKSQAEKKEKPEKVNPKANMLELESIQEKKIVLVPYPEPKGKHQFNQTTDAVDWASWTWNPVTGCLHGCPYCYAREMAYRDSYKATYPVQFAPLFHHERLNDPVNTKPGDERPQDGRVFVCSMADLFGEWVPQKWIDAVLDATLEAPEWEYLFLTKFPQRYRRINLPPKAWFGASVDIQKRVKVTEKSMPLLDVAVRWLSIEPLLEPLKFNDLSWCDLMVIGAQSETVQPNGFVPAFAPEFEWVIDLISQARAFNVPVYMKPNLLGIATGSKPGMQLIQEMPRLR